VVAFEWENPDRLFSQVRAMLVGRGKGMARIPEMAVRSGAFELLAMIQAKLPKKTATLVRNTTVQVERPSPDVYQARIGSHMSYAPYVEYGTGIYGPKGKPIVPVRAKALAWPAPSLLSGGWAKRKTVLSEERIIRRSVKGMKPRPAYAESIARFLPRYIDIIQRELAKEASR
jgi:hypothetical protein